MAQEAGPVALPQAEIKEVLLHACRPLLVGESHRPQEGHVGWEHKTAGKEGDAEARRNRGGGLRKGGWRVAGHERGAWRKEAGRDEGTRKKLEKQTSGGRRKPIMNPQGQGTSQMTQSRRRTCLAGTNDHRG